MGEKVRNLELGQLCHKLERRVIKLFTPFTDPSRLTYCYYYLLNSVNSVNSYNEFLRDYVFLPYLEHDSNLYIYKLPMQKKPFTLHTRHSRSSSDARMGQVFSD